MMDFSGILVVTLLEKGLQKLANGQQTPARYT